MIDYANILQNGVEISSSGTTGEPKMVLRTPENLQACIDIAIDAQQLVRSSKVLTVTRMTHAGGLLTQTLPAYSIGAEFKVQKFNAFTFLKDFANYTHTFLAPAQFLCPHIPIDPNYTLTPCRKSFRCCLSSENIPDSLSGCLIDRSWVDSSL